MSKFKKQVSMPLQKTYVEKKEFSYKKGNCSLSFTLQVNKNEFKDFRECLEQGLKDVDEILERL